MRRLFFLSVFLLPLIGVITITPGVFAAPVGPTPRLSAVLEPSSPWPGGEIKLTIKGCDLDKPVLLSFKINGVEVAQGQIAKAGQNSAVFTSSDSKYTQSGSTYEVAAGCLAGGTPVVEVVETYTVAAVTPTLAPDEFRASVQPKNPPDAGSNVQIYAEGCPSGDVAFTIARSNPNLPGLLPYLGSVATEANGTATITEQKCKFLFSDCAMNVGGTTYNVTLTCKNTGKQTSVSYTPVSASSGSGSASDTPTPFPTQPPPPPPPCGDDIETAGKCNHVRTGLGLLAADGIGLIFSLYQIILSMSGGIMILLIMYSGYTLMTSRGSPEQIQKGREMITSALVGFLFIIFSYVIFGFLTTDILHLPGFGGGSIFNP